MKLKPLNLVLASNNKHKLQELSQLADGEDWLHLQLAPAGFDPEETGSTFVANAIIKAKEAATMANTYAVADDSGIEVDALDGAPGIYSARYCEGSDADRRRKLLEETVDVIDGERGAAFVCAMAVCAPDGSTVFETTVKWKGLLTREERGENGFGYDPIFFLEEFGRTSAEISPSEKNAISHRGQAWQQVVKFLKSMNS